MTVAEEPEFGDDLGSIDPAVGLRAVGALQRLQERLETLHVGNAREQGWSWQSIADALGVSRQAVHQKYTRRKRGLMFERFAKPARVAVVLAQEEARDPSAGQIGAEHLLVAVLESASDPLAGVLEQAGLTADGLRGRLTPVADSTFEADAEALAAIGIDLHAVRDSVTESFGADAFDDAFRNSRRRRRRRGHIPFNRGAKKALESALREAVGHKSKEIGIEHVALGILRADDRRMVELVGGPASLEDLRAAIDPLAHRG